MSKIGSILLGVAAGTVAGIKLLEKKLASLKEKVKK